ncbi:MAG: hypothetical protein IJA90_11370 [Peptococcaceae bacterium]|nr:hypothetical protein [Peptococcaceae bacterium]
MTIKEKIANEDCPGTIVAIIVYLFLINCFMVIGLIIMVGAMLDSMSTAYSLEKLIYYLCFDFAPGIAVFILQCAMMRWLSQGKKTGYYVSIVYFAITCNIICIFLMLTEKSKKYFGVLKEVENNSN